MRDRLPAAGLDIAYALLFVVVFYFTIVTSFSAQGAEGGMSTLEMRCQSNSDCRNITHSECRDDGSNTGTSRCQCETGYHPYSGSDQITADDTYCGLILSPTANATCLECVNNEGVCYDLSENDTARETAASPRCSCPVMRTGPSCETLTVNVTCDGPELLMKICYNPHPWVNFSAGWMMSTVEHASAVPSCIGSTVDDARRNLMDWCRVGSQALVLNLTADRLQECGTDVVRDSSTTTYQNTLVIKSAVTSSASPITFRTHCTYKTSDQQTFKGLGIYWNPDDNRGQTVNPDIDVSLVNEFDQLIPPGVVVRVDDPVRFKIALNNTGSYSSLNVQWCTASTSAVIPDKFADTRPVIQNGCPVSTIENSDSWFWTVADAQVKRQYVVQTGLVPAFKLANSHTVFLHCTLYLCLTGDICHLNNKTDCAGQRSRRSSVDVARKRLRLSAALYRKRRSADSYDVLGRMDVYDKNEMSAAAATGGTDSTMLAVFIAVLSAVVMLLTIIGAVVAWRLKRYPQSEPSPQMFAKPRIEQPYGRP